MKSPIIDHSCNVLEVRTCVTVCLSEPVNRSWLPLVSELNRIGNCEFQEYSHRVQTTRQS